ncbi:MAG: ribosomal RNA small subunit methyltransferase A [Parcubacteria group bacterium]|nr:ribosomal RNA small subunit methyltransferase A [Parcubacteria group bacterium]
MTHAKKSLGQNFLKDKKILKKIVDFAQIKKTDTVVEVGPGQGSLTELLVERAKKIIAIEKDENLVVLLKDKFAKIIKEGRLEIVGGDILDLKLKKNSCSLSAYQILLNFCSTQSTSAHSQDCSRFSTEKYLLVGNIPYYITGALFKKAFEAKKTPESLTFVVQKEVADRILAKDGKESILSISIKAYGEPHFGGIIKAGSFNPKPKVDSAIIAVRNINKKRFLETQKQNDFEKRFFEILKKGFAHKRKLLAKNLNIKSEILKKCGLSEKARAEDLKINDWINLAKEIV